MNTEKRTLFYKLTIFSDQTGNAAVAMHETKSATFFGDEQVTPWMPDEPTDLPLPLSQDILGEINASLIESIAAMKTVHAEEIAKLNEKDATVLAAKDAEIYALKNPVSPATAYLLTLPEEVQTQFAPAFKIVRALIETGEKVEALAYLEALAVPNELESAKAQIVDLLSGD